MSGRSHRGAAAALAGMVFLAPLAGGARAATQVDEVHYTVTGQTSVTFDWRGPASENVIRSGTKSGVYTKSVTGVTPSPAPTSSSGPFWEAKITGLFANTTYYYKIGSDAEHTLRTPRATGTSSFVVAAEGDIGDADTYPNVGVIQGQIASIKPAFVLAVGDLTYGNAHGMTAVDRHFHDVMKWSLSSAYMPAWGNHEWDSCSVTATSCSSDNLTNYKGRFDLPNPQTSPGAPVLGGKGEDWSWFDYGNVRFIAYPEPWSGAWSDWNAKVRPIMAAVQSDSDINYIVTFGHRPAYSSGHHPGSSTLASYMNALGDKYSKYILNINGHSHDYERTYPQHGVIHVTAGTGGSSLEQDGSCLWRTCAKPSWSAVRYMHQGLLKLTFTATGIEGVFICGPAGGGTNDITCSSGQVLDTFLIGKSSS